MRGWERLLSNHRMGAVPKVSQVWGVTVVCPTWGKEMSSKMMENPMKEVGESKGPRSLPSMRKFKVRTRER